MAQPLPLEAHMCRGETTDGVRQGLASALGSAYVLGRELNGGAMSRVFSAWDIALGRPVVIKVLPPMMAGVDAAARFRREIRLAAQLEHPNIVPLLAAGEVNGLLYYTMPYVDGESLRARLDRDGPLDPPTVQRVLTELARALDHAHRHGVVHRDVKPENIYLESATGRALLADFGIARPIDAEPADGLTGTGVAVGTPTYMSPEQMDGPVVDGRSDLYSLGLVGWEMLAGERPWAGESIYSIIYSQKFERLRPIRTVRRDVPMRLRRTIERALAKDPRARWRSGDALASHLQTPTFPDRWRGSGKTGGRQALLVVAGMGLFVAVTGRPAPPSATVGSPGVVVMADAEQRPATDVTATADGSAPVALSSAGDVVTAVPATDEANRKLDRVYGQLEAVFREPAARQELRHAQDVWRRDRDRACSHRKAQLRCQGELAGRRTAELAELLARASGRM
jgi:tRNA A-37 threonylcarbamoyl transferase component Bud32